MLMQGTAALRFFPIQQLKVRREMKKIYVTVPAWVFALAASIVSPHKANAEVKYFATCAVVSEVAVLENRIHVRCKDPQVTGIIYYAVSTASSNNAARFLTVFTTALVENRKLTILYDDFEIAGQEWGCLIENCRIVHGAFLGPRP
jgi:hypothetical protein